MRASTRCRQLLSSNRRVLSIPSPPLSTSPFQTFAGSIASSSKTGLQSKRRSNFIPTCIHANFYGTAVTDPEDPELVLDHTLPSHQTSVVVGQEGVSRELHEIRLVLEREIGGADLWLERVEAAVSDLRRARRKRIGVYGESVCAPQDLVSALLQDPLVDLDTSRKALLSRHDDPSNEALYISYGKGGRRPGFVIQSEASWLKNSEYDLVEVNTTANTDVILSHLLQTDSILLVLDPIRLLSCPTISKIIPTLLAKGSLQFVINGHLPPHSTETTLTAELTQQLKEVDLGDLPRPATPPVVSFAQAEHALTALDALARGLKIEGSGSSQSRAFDIFQQQYLKSNLGPLQSRLLKTIPQTQLETARTTAELALSYITSTVSSDRSSTQSVSYTISHLRRTATQAGVRAKHLSVVNRGIDGGLVQGSIEQEMQAGKHQLQDTFRTRFNWSNLIVRLRIDDVGAEIASFIERRFGRDLEQRLTFETGQLAELQDSLSKSSDMLLHQLSAKSGRGSIPAPHPFSSRILLNHLSTLSLSIPPLETTSLLSPVSSRRQQLLGFPILRIQQSAQRVLLSTYATALLSISLSWVICVDPLSLISSSTAIGTGLLGCVASFAVGQHMWERTQKRFWKDWDRIIYMLKGDLQAQFVTTLAAQVLAKPLAAADGLEQLVKKREDRLDNLQQQVDEIRSRLGISR